MHFYLYSFPSFVRFLQPAFLSITPSFIGAKKNEGKSYAVYLERLKEDVDEPLIAILTIKTKMYVLDPT